MTAFNLFAQPAAKAIAHLADRLTYEDVPLVERPDSCPYLGHVPYFAPKLTKSEKVELAQ